jgi:sugar lactone lactonase YvrE
MPAATRILVDNNQGLKFTESPRWHDGKLWFLDIHGKAIKTVELDGTLATVLDLPFLPNGFGIAADGTLIFGDALTRKIYRWDGKTLQVTADLTQLTVFCLSDGILDAKGRLYIGDIGYNFFDPANQPVNTCVLVRVDPGGSASVVADGLSFPNGMVFYPDGKTLVVAECMAHRLTAFDVDDSGALHNRRVWAELPEGTHPDGICMDAEGAIWVANPEGEDKVLRVLEGGQITHRIQVATDAFAVALGGTDGRQLFVCTAASHNPAEIARNPTARIEVLDVGVAAAA